MMYNKKLKKLPAREAVFVFIKAGQKDRSTFLSWLPVVVSIGMTAFLAVNSGNNAFTLFSKFVQ